MKDKNYIGVLIAVLRLLGVFHDFLYGDDKNYIAGVCVDVVVYGH